MKHLLFVCSRNQWRSPTAEAVWRAHPQYAVRSAGTSPRARKTVTPSDLNWADVVFVMEKKHKHRLLAQYGRLLNYTPVHVLHIPDEYRYMDPELVSLLEQGVAGYLEVDPPG